MSFFDLYRSAGYKPKRAGLGYQTYNAQRGLLLAQAVKQGKIKPAQLSASDLAAAGPAMAKVGGPPSTVGKVGNIFENFGSDVWDATKGFFPGVYHAVKAAGQDITDIPLHGKLVGGSSFYKDILKPIGQTYAYTYGGKGAPEGSSFLDRLAEHPLGPILDALTVASLGAGGAARAGTALSKAGKIGAEHPLARMGQTSQRPSLLTDPQLAARRENLQVPSVDRYYSSRPLRKGGQVLTDKAGQRLPFIESLQRNVTRAGHQKLGYSKKESQVLRSIKAATDPIVPLLAKLTPSEVHAFELIGRGINTPGLIESYQRAVREGIKGGDKIPEGQRYEDYAGSVDPQLSESRANIPLEVQDLVLKPEQSPNLMEAMSSYRDTIKERVEPDIGDPEQLASKQYELRDALAERYPEGGRQRGADGRFKKHEDIWTPRPDYPFEGTPTVMPSEIGKGFKMYEPGLIGRTLGGREAGFARDKKGRIFNPSNISYQNLFQEGPMLGFHPRADPLLAGVQRPDARAFVDLIAKHEREVVEQVYNDKALAQWALKDKNGEPVMLQPGESIDKYGPNWVAVNAKLPIHWFSQETSIAQMVQHMESQGVDMSEIAARVGAEAEDMAGQASLMAKREPSMLLPREVVDYQYKIERASRPYENKLGRGYARTLNLWRTMTLAMMPRWALNTAVGSFILNNVKGVGPRAYLTAGKMHKGQAETGFMESLGSRDKRRQRKEDIEKSSFFLSPQLSGVNLGNVTGMELLESGSQGYANAAFQVKVGPVGRSIMHKVQAIEDYFRRASFVQSLDRQSKRMMAEGGAIIENLERSKGPRSVDEYTEMILENPEAVGRALEDVNRFSYNFAALGPMERRYVRQAIPFWGWYKFISTLAYRLPIDHPGRANVMAQLGALGTEKTQEAWGGAAPPWLAGSLPIGGIGENFKYLSTMGLNPFSQILNPLGPQGPVQGALTLGQATPWLQALLGAYGTDTMRGGEVAISPQSGVGKDFLGRLIDTTTGTETDIGQESSGSRLIAGLARSFPQYRIAERGPRTPITPFASGGRSVYPESLPWAQRFMPTKPESQFGGSLTEMMEQYVGVAPRPFNLADYQALLPKSVKYARTRNARALARLKRNLEAP